MVKTILQGGPLQRGQITHSMEIPFVFDTLGLGTQPLLGLSPPQSLATTMHNAWVSFAKTGDCDWPKYDDVHRSTMHFDIISEVVRDPLGAKLALWAGVR